MPLATRLGVPVDVSLQRFFVRNLMQFSEVFAVFFMVNSNLKMNVCLTYSEGRKVRSAFRQRNYQAQQRECLFIWKFAVTTTTAASTKFKRRSQLLFSFPFFIY